MVKGNMLVMTYKIPIIKPISTDWNTFNKVAGDITYNAIKIMNDAVDMHYLHIKESYRYKKKYGKRMNVKDKYNVATYTTVINRELKKRYKKCNIPGDLFEQIIKQGIDTFNTVGNDILKGNAKLITFRRDQPIPVRARSLKLSEDYTVKLPFMTRETADNYGFEGRGKQNFEVQLGVKGKAKVILNRILSNEYQMRDSKVQRTLEGKWYLIVTYKQPMKEMYLDKETIMGVELGIKKAAYMALNNSKQNFFIDGGEVESFRRRIQGRRKSLQHQLRVCSENRRGHGRKTLLKPLEKLSNKESNFRNTVNHRYSKKIVEWAVNHNVGTIQMEDLTGISKKSSFLADWDYYDLQQKIEYKANKEGIEVIKVRPMYTSQMCNKCGSIHENNVRGKQIFHCIECGNKTDEDLNAARNIAIKGIDEIIEEELKGK